MSRYIRARDYIYTTFMDSLSQIVLGAAVGELTFGKKLGNKAMLWGSIAGTIPDLDILANIFVKDELIRLHIHRGWTHSMWIQIPLSWLFAKLTFRWVKDPLLWRRWWLFWYLTFLTHTLLDCCTTYGTQLMAPFSNTLVGFNNIAVVDPFWTIPYLLTLGVCLFIRRDNPSRKKWAIAASVWASVYMAYTCVNKLYVHQKMSSSLAAQQIEYNELSTSPSMFNNWLWAGIATSNDSIFIAEYSVLQKDDCIQWLGYPLNKDLIEQCGNREMAATLTWFGQGKSFALPTKNGFDYFIIKWGRANITETEAHKAFMFYWEVQNDGGNCKSHPIQPQWDRSDLREAMGKFKERILEGPTCD
jgi:inner membrane protein